MPSCESENRWHSANLGAERSQVSFDMNAMAEQCSTHFDEPIETSVVVARRSCSTSTAHADTKVSGACCGNFLRRMMNSGISLSRDAGRQKLSPLELVASPRRLSVKGHERSKGEASLHTVSQSATSGFRQEV